MGNRQYIIKDDKIIDEEEYYLEQIGKYPFYTIVDHKEKIIHLIPINTKGKISKAKLRTLLKDYQKLRIKYWQYEVKQENKV